MDLPLSLILPKTYLFIYLFIYFTSNVFPSIPSLPFLSPLPLGKEIGVCLSLQDEVNHGPRSSNGE